VFPGPRLLDGQAATTDLAPRTDKRGAPRGSSTRAPLGLVPTHPSRRRLTSRPRVSLRRRRSRNGGEGAGLGAGGPPRGRSAASGPPAGARPASPPSPQHSSRSRELQAPSPAGGPRVGARPPGARRPRDERKGPDETTDSGGSWTAAGPRAAPGAPGLPASAPSPSPGQRGRVRREKRRAPRRMPRPPVCRDDRLN